MPKPLRYLFIALALLGLCFAIWTGIPRHPEAADDSAAPAQSLDGVQQPEKAPELSGDSSDRTETPAEQAARTKELDAAAQASEPAVAEALPATLTVRFVDVNGTPLPDVLVVDRTRDAVRATSDGSGRVTLQVPQPLAEATWRGEFLARRHGNASKLLQTSFTTGSLTPMGDVVLGPGADVHGRAVDERGQGIAATVGFAMGAIEFEDDAQTRRYGAAHFERSLAVSASETGEFVVHGVEPGECRVWARRKDTRYGWTEPFPVLEGVDVHGIVVVVPALRDSDTITGIVLAPDGNPLAKARLSYSFETEHGSGSTSTQLGSDGRFSIPIEDDDVTFDIGATDPEDRYSEVRVAAVKPGTHGLELRLGEFAPFHLVLRGPSGEPVDGCTLKIRREVREDQWSERSSTPKSNGGGRYELSAPVTRIELVIEAPGYRRHRTGTLEPPTPGSTLEIQLAKLEFLRGRVLAEGAPVAGARVRSFADAGDAVVTVNGFRALHDDSAQSEALTDAEGRFELPVHEDERLWLRAESDGFAACELGPLAPVGVERLELDLFRGGVIEGVVLLPDATDAQGTIVGVSRGDGFGLTQRAGVGGRFRFEGLTPGPWQVLHRDSERKPGSRTTGPSIQPKPIEWSCEVRDGHTTRFDLDLSRP